MRYLAYGHENGNNGNGGNGGNGGGNGNNIEGLVYFYHPDHLGSSSYITDANGEVSQHLEYFAFGETFVEEHSNKDRTPYLYNAKELDEETGLYYYGARYYSPEVSIWLSVDPLWEQVGANRSPYEYTYSNPINFTDPTGMSPETYIVNGDTGDSTYVDDGSNDIVVVSDSNYNATVEAGQSAYGTCTGSCDASSANIYESYLSEGKRHTIDNFSTGDKRLDHNISSLDPRVRSQMIVSSIEARTKGIDVRGAYQGGHRTYEEQNDLYAKGRTKPGRRVTNARGGQSNHNFGLSMDVAIFKNGKYLTKGTESEYKKFGEISESHGLEWGGRWSRPFDPAHVQSNHGYSMKELRALPKDSNGYIKADLPKNQ